MRDYGVLVGAQAVLLVLKLTHAIEWNWFRVAAPTVLTLSVAGLISLVAFLNFILVEKIKKRVS